MKVFKYKLHQLGENVIAMPEGARIVSAGLDLGDFLCVWAEVDENAPTIDTSIYALYTGHHVPKHCRFLATVVGSLVYHIYILPPST